MNEKKPTPPFVWYLAWLALMWYSATYHWLYPLIVFSISGVFLYNSPNGKPLQQIVQAVQRQQKGDFKKAQQISFALGLGLVVLTLPILRSVANQVDQKRNEETARQLAVQEQRRGAAQAEKEAAEAKAAAAKAEEARLQAQTEATRAQALAQAQKADEQRRAIRDKQRAADEAARQKRYADSQAAAEAERQKRQANAAAQQQQQAQEAEQKKAQDEQERQAAEGPYTKNQAEQMCKEKVAAQYDVRANAVIQRGSYVEIMDHPPRNMEFGGQRVWNWEPSLEIAGADIQIDIQCTVYPNGDVKIGNQ